MRLLDTKTQELIFFPERGRPRYAILSHTWEADEVLFADIINRNQDWRQRAGAEKVLASCQLAREKGFEHLWIDSCCIDKSSSAELSEAINSMFTWYMNAEVCYVYLTDVAEDGSIAKCRWFKRGWTLQELIAPTSVDFYDKQWRFINDKISMSSELAKITTIDESLLRCGHTLNPPLLENHHMQEASEEDSEISGRGCSCGRPYSVSRLSQLQAYCVAQKMSWASTRETTRGEDMAYCLMGLFGINMPLLYGEGSRRACSRLQREILETTHDQSILAIKSFPKGEPITALASHPNQFTDSGCIDFRPYAAHKKRKTGESYSKGTTELTKDGVMVDILVVPEYPNWFRVYGILDFQMGKNPLGRLAIPLHPITRVDKSPVSCRRGEGLFVISPEHSNYARDLRVSAGRSDLQTLPDRRIQMQAVKRLKVMILHSSQRRGFRTYRQGIQAPFHCVSNSPDCVPYSVESESPGYAILGKPGYPRLLVHTSIIDGLEEWSSMMWLLEDVHFKDGFVPDEAEDARHLLAKIKARCRFFCDNESITLIETDERFYHGCRTLTVGGSPRLKVEVSVLPLEFLDWTMPQVTVRTTEVKSSKRKRQPY